MRKAAKRAVAPHAYYDSVRFNHRIADRLNPIGGWCTLGYASISSRQQSSAMRASGPTARPAHSFAQLINPDFDTTLPGLFLLGRCDPTDPLVARQWGDIDP